MPCRAYIWVPRKDVDPMNTGRYGTHKDRPCGKKDFIAYKIQKHYSTGNWCEVYTFCQEHAPGRDDIKNWNRDNTSRFWGSPIIIGEVPLEDRKTTKDERIREYLKYSIKKLLKTKIAASVNMEFLLECAEDAFNEYMVETVNKE